MFTKITKSSRFVGLLGLTMAVFTFMGPSCNASTPCWCLFPTNSKGEHECQFLGDYIIWDNCQRDCRAKYGQQFFSSQSDCSNGCKSGSDAFNAD